MFQYDLPSTIDNYLHRAGRTGRMGKEEAAYRLSHTKSFHL